jgi:hypothetical protein
MRILIASPLYPPDIAEPAPYTKELARRLGGTHAVTVVTYGNFPEKVPNVRIVHTSKKRPLPVRLLAYTFLLLKESSQVDAIYALNGASVELPATIVSFITNKPLYVYLGDHSAHAHAQKNFVLRYVEKLFLARAKEVIERHPLPRPEILPLEQEPTAELAIFEKTWQEHITVLEHALHHG